MPTPVRINQRQLMTELAASEPILRKEADRIMREEFFDPAVAELKAQFTNHPVTREIQGGVDADNESGTLPGNFRQDEGDSKPNLFSFIGFEAGSNPTMEIEQRLDPRHPDGPKMTYRGMDRNKLEFRYQIEAPNEQAIEEATPLPWAAGISWVKRIEQGIPGVGYFLNRLDKPTSRSGGGIQIEGQLREGRFRPTSYLSKLFNNFLRGVVGRKQTGRRV